MGRKRKPRIHEQRAQVTFLHTLGGIGPDERKQCLHDVNGNLVVLAYWYETTLELGFGKIGHEIKSRIEFKKDRMYVSCECGTESVCRHLLAGMFHYLRKFCDLDEVDVWGPVTTGRASTEPPTSGTTAESKNAPAASPKGGGNAKLHEEAKSKGSAGPKDDAKVADPPSQFESTTSKIDRAAESAARSIGRPLNAVERIWLVSLHDCFEIARLRGHVTGHQMAALGFPTPSSFDSRYWPEFPRDLWPFLLHLTAEGRAHGGTIKHVLASAEDLAPVESALESARRSQEARRWRELFEKSARPWTRSDQTIALDLFVVIDLGRVTIERRMPGSSRLSALDRKAFETLRTEIDAGRVTVPFRWAPVEAALDAFYGTGYSALHVMSDRNSRRRFSCLLRIDDLADRLINRLGQPIARESGPLQWKIETKDDPSNVVAALHDADGKPIGAAQFVSPDAPHLIIANGRLYDRCPPIPDFAVPDLTFRCPLNAVASEPGVGFFDDFRVPIPPKIAARVHRLKLKPIVAASSVPSADPSDGERVRINIRAELPDGTPLAEHDGDGWRFVTGRPAKAATPMIDGLPKDAIFVIDRSALCTADALIQTLGLRKKSDDPFFEKKLSGALLSTLSKLSAESADVYDFRFDGDLATLSQPPTKGAIKLEVREDGVDWFDLRLVLTVDDTSLTKEEIDLLSSAGGDFVKLPNRGWRRLQVSLTDEDDRRLADMGLSARDASEKSQKFHALQLTDPAARKLLPPEVAKKVARRVEALAVSGDVASPKALEAALRPYQLDGFRFLVDLARNGFGGILADDMGLGKTVQALAWILWMRETSSADRRPILVVCPKSVADNWRAETEKFAPTLRARTWSAKDLAALSREIDGADLHILNYHQLRSAEAAVKEIAWKACILDEGQAIKNPSSATAEIARAIRADHRLVMTGTPIENRCLDLWSLMSFAMPGVLGPRAHFSRVFEAKDDPLARRRLSARTRPFLIRRTKDKVAADLPAKVEEDLFCEMDGIQATLYGAELKKAQQLLLAAHTQAEVAKLRFNVLTSLLRLRQICCDPRLVKPDADGPSAKVDALLEHLEPLVEEGQKVLVFSQFVDAIDLIETAVKTLACPIYRLTGETEDRGALVKEFQEKEGAAVFLISLRAGGFGLNLTSASYVVLFDPWWNPAVESQAIDRTHRIGQKKTVFAHRILVKGSIEEKIRLLQKRKAAVSDEVFGEEKFSQSLSLDDLKYLFAD